VTGLAYFSSFYWYCFHYWH